MIIFELINDDDDRKQWHGCFQSLNCTKYVLCNPITSVI